MPPRRNACSLASSGVVKVTDEACAFSVCVRYRLHEPGTESGPPSGQALGPPPTRSTCDGVPYHAMSTRPSSPAAIQPKTLLASPGVGTLTGADHVFPSFFEYAYISALSPACAPVIGACSQRAYKFPARSTASDGKLPPVRTALGSPRFATGR